MFKNLDWKVLLRRVLELALAALLGGTGTYLLLNEAAPQYEVETILALAPSFLG